MRLLRSSAKYVAVYALATVEVEVEELHQGQIVVKDLLIFLDCAAQSREKALYKKKYTICSAQCN